jgi:hypothetical protein
MKDNLADVEGRVRRYWFTDGIGELMGGALFLLLGLYFAAQQYVGEKSPVGVILQSGFIVLVIGGMFVGRWMINQLKTRVTYPRTGYVEYRVKDKNSVRRRTIAFALAMAVAMFAIVITRNINTIDSMVALTGLLVSAILLFNQGWAHGVGRFYVLSAVALILGIVLSVSGFARGYNLGLFYGFMGICFIISGGLTLRHYLSENPMPVEESNER